MEALFAVKGPKGNTGATGPQGPKGATGPQGPAGTPASTTCMPVASFHTLNKYGETNATPPYLRIQNVGNTGSYVTFIDSSNNEYQLFCLQFG